MKYQSSVEIDQSEVISLSVCFLFQVENAVEMGFSTTMRDHSQSAQTETPTSNHAPRHPQLRQVQLHRSFKIKYGLNVQIFFIHIPKGTIQKHLQKQQKFYNVLAFFRLIAV